MNQPIATYREQRFEGKRTFTLFHDRVHISGTRQYSSDFELSVPLKTLNPEPMRIRLRHTTFFVGFLMLGGSVVGCTVLSSALHVAYDSAAFVLVAVFGATGLAFMLRTSRKVEFASFQSIPGLHILDIAKSGPDAVQMETFVEVLSTSIRAAASKD